MTSPLSERVLIGFIPSSQAITAVNIGIAGASVWTAVRVEQALTGIAFSQTSDCSPSDPR
jgi:hypothetical protein